MQNLNLLFHKVYYKTIGQTGFSDDCSKNNKKIVSTVFKRSDDYLEADSLLSGKMKKILMKTTYPGMLVGIGYTHGTDNDNDIKIGFSFDYVSGQPYIPGSSIKGLLRSCFKEHPADAAKIINKVLSTEDNPANYTADDVKNLEKEIFDYGDVFLDAVVARGASYPNSHGGNLMDLDNITPHRKKHKQSDENITDGDNITRDPTPLLLLRIMPEVVFEFRFVLKDGILKADEKLKVFEKIIEIFGAGAKTNVGYGNLTPCSVTSLNNEYAPAAVTESEQTQGAACNATRTVNANATNLKKDDEVSGVVEEIKSEQTVTIKLDGGLGYAILNLEDVSGFNPKKAKGRQITEVFNIGDRIEKARIKSISGSGVIKLTTKDKN